MAASAMAARTSSGVPSMRSEEGREGGREGGRVRACLE